MDNEAAKILAEIGDMLDPDLSIYPNPSFMCPRMCSFLETCLERDRGDDYESTLEMNFRTEDYSSRNTWRKFLRVGRKNDKDVVKAIANTLGVTKRKITT
jgi:hypothetical protein